MYEIDVKRLLTEIGKTNAKRVLIQLPDGMKTKAGEIVDIVEKETGAEAFIWFGSCFGACDTPQGMAQLGFDLIVAYGHNRYNKTEDW
jgi:2-(3-amino-3-carboxypropyl)histidine synthase